MSKLGKEDQIYREYLEKNNQSKDEKQVQKIINSRIFYVRKNLKIHIWKSTLYIQKY